MNEEQLQLLVNFIEVIKKHDKKSEIIKNICRRDYCSQIKPCRSCRNIQ